MISPRNLASPLALTAILAMGTSLHASEETLELNESQRIALVGNSTAERMNLFGHLETMMQLRFHRLAAGDSQFRLAG